MDPLWGIKIYVNATLLPTLGPYMLISLVAPKTLWIQIMKFRFSPLKGI